MALKPNTVCGNLNCTKGEDGGRKKYYTCYVCLKNRSWRIAACCYECYLEYLKQEDNKVQTRRLDLSDEQVLDLQKNKNYKEIQKMTKEELKDYSEILEEQGLAKTLEKVNEDIDKTEFECPYCARTFKTMRGMNNHISTKHKEVFNEDISTRSSN